MARRPSTTRSAPTSNACITPADARTAAALPPGARSPVRQHTTVFVDAFAAPAMQSTLRALARDLAAYAGCGDIESVLEEAVEGKELNAIADHLANSLAAVLSRIVAINSSLGSASTSLAHAQASAPAGSPVKKRLKAFVEQRTAARGTAKAVQTRKRRAHGKPKPART